MNLVKAKIQFLIDMNTQRRFQVNRHQEFLIKKGVSIPQMIQMKMVLMMYGGYSVIKQKVFERDLSRVASA